MHTFIRLGLILVLSASSVSAEDVQPLEPEAVRQSFIDYIKVHPDFVAEFTSKLGLENPKFGHLPNSSTTRIGALEVDLVKRTYRFESRTVQDPYPYASNLIWSGQLSLGIEGKVHVLSPSLIREAL